MDHLDPAVRPLLALSDERRIAHIYAAKWIGYSQAQAIHARMERMFVHPVNHRMPGLLIVGGTNNGKTTLLRRFQAQHPTVDDPAQEALHLPVLLVQCPPGPDENRFYNSLLTTMNCPFRWRATPDEKLHQAKHMMQKVGTRILMLDELHNALAGPTVRLHKFLNAIKNITNDFVLPLVCAGTDEAYNVVSANPQIQNRLPPMKLPPWKDGKEFWSLLASFERLLPLAKPSGLKEEALSAEIHQLSEGILGEAATLLTDAARVAVLTGEERITLKIIRSLGFVPPESRRLYTSSGSNDGGVLE